MRRNASTCSPENDFSAGSSPKESRSSIPIEIYQLFGARENKNKDRQVVETLDLKHLLIRKENPISLGWLRKFDFSSTHYSL
jgi:hypothetical protein